MNLDVLMRGRARAEERMTATCTITRTGSKVWNPATLQYVKGTVTSYTGPCRVKRPATQARAENAADQSFTESQSILCLPVDTSGDVNSDDLVTIDTCLEDSDLVGRKFTVGFVPAYSQGTERRIPVTESQ